jgi:hypothetical protein
VQSVTQTVFNQYYSNFAVFENAKNTTAGRFYGKKIKIITQI